jgi:hypothetical protein
LHEGRQVAPSEHRNGVVVSLCARDVSSRRCVYSLRQLDTISVDRSLASLKFAATLRGGLALFERQTCATPEPLAARCSALNTAASTQ